MYYTIKTCIERVPTLSSKVFPVCELVSELKAPFCIVDSQSCVPERTMSGKVMWYDEVFELGFEAKRILDAAELAEQVESYLMELVNTVTSSGKRIMSVSCSRTDNDAQDMATGLMRRPLRVELRWHYN